MRKQMALVLALAITESAAVAGANKGVLADADAAWKYRDDTAALKVSVKALEKTAEAAPSGFESAWRLARAYGWLAEQVDDTSKKEALGRAGVTWGEKAQALEPDRIEGHFYVAIALGMYSEAIGATRALREGLKGRFDDALDKALAMNRDFDHGGPLRMKGRSYFLLPGFVGGSNRRAIEWLEASLKTDPSSLRTKYYLAVVYEDNGGADRRLALKLVDEIVTADPKLGDFSDNLAAQRWARALKARLGEE
jgi:tetratricopeptide (TPR) repeat protein